MAKRCGIALALLALTPAAAWAQDEPDGLGEGFGEQTIESQGMGVAFVF